VISELKLVFDEIGTLKEEDINAPDLTQEGVEQWFNQIRLTDQSQALQQILDYLIITNQYIYPIDNRRYLIEKLHLPTISLVGNLKPKYLDSLMPLSKENNSQVDLCVLVYQQLVLAYSIILNEQLANKNKTWLFLKSLDTKMALSIQRIIRYLSQIVLTEFEIYRDSNGLVWKKLYSLFSFSEKKNFSNNLILDPLINEEPSVKLTFLQVLLLALSDPYHYSQSQIYYIYKHLANWAKLVELVAHKSVRQELFTAINLTDNYMPTFYPRGHQPRHQQVLFLDAHKLSIDVLNEDRNTSNSFLSPKIKESLLKQLKVAWSVYIDRSFDRNDYYTELKVVIGLNNVHYVLNDYQHPLWSKKSAYTSRDKAKSEDDYEKMMDQLPFQNNKPNELDVENITLTPVITTNLNDQDNSSQISLFDESNIVNTFLTENESLNGLSLLWVNDSPINLKIGEVIALSHDKRTKPDNWFIGVIRRIQHFKNEPLKVGIQLLCPSGAIPIEVKQKDQYNIHRGLLLPEFSLSSENESLLVSSLTFHKNDSVKLSNSLTGEENKFNSMVNLEEEVETTPFYMRFKLK
jgi:hypothetical protein